MDIVQVEPSRESRTSFGGPDPRAAGPVRRGRTTQPYWPRRGGARHPAEDPCWSRHLILPDELDGLLVVGRAVKCCLPSHSHTQRFGQHAGSRRRLRPTEHVVRRPTPARLVDVSARSLVLLDSARWLQSGNLDASSRASPPAPRPRTPNGAAWLWSRLSPAAAARRLGAPVLSHSPSLCMYGHGGQRSQGEGGGARLPSRACDHAHKMSARSPRLCALRYGHATARPRLCTARESAFLHGCKSTARFSCPRDPVRRCGPRALFNEARLFFAHCRRIVVVCRSRTRGASWAAAATLPPSASKAQF